MWFVLLYLVGSLICFFGFLHPMLQDWEGMNMKVEEKAEDISKLIVGVLIIGWLLGLAAIPAVIVGVIYFCLKCVIQKILLKFMKKE